MAPQVMYQTCGPTIKCHKCQVKLDTLRDGWYWLKCKVWCLACWMERKR